MTKILFQEGKAKKIYRTDDAHLLRLLYKDEATAFNGKKFDYIEGKGRLNNIISSTFFKHLKMHNIPNHFVEQISDTEQLVHAVRIIPLEVVVRNTAAGSLCRRLGWKAGRRLSFPIVEYYYKDDTFRLVEETK